MALTDSLLSAIVRADGDALVMHVGERPYVVVGTQTINISTHGLNLEVMTGMLTQLLTAEAHGQLEEFGAVEHTLPHNGDDRFSVVAARGGDDIWIEIRRRRPKPAPAPEVAPVDAPAAVATEPVEAAPPVEPIHEPAAKADDVAEPAPEPVSPAPVDESSAPMSETAPELEMEAQPAAIAEAPIVDAPIAQAPTADVAAPEFVSVETSMPVVDTPAVEPQMVEQAPIVEPISEPAMAEPEIAQSVPPATSEVTPEIVAAAPDVAPAVEAPIVEWPAYEPQIFETVPEPEVVEVTQAPVAEIAQEVTPVMESPVESPAPEPEVVEAAETPIAEVAREVEVPAAAEPAIEEPAPIEEPAAIEEPAPIEQPVHRVGAVAEVPVEEPAPAEPEAPAQPSSFGPEFEEPLTRRVRIEVPPRHAARTTPVIDRLLHVAAARGATALYLLSDSFPSVRVEGDLRQIETEGQLTRAEVEHAILEIAPETAHDSIGRGEATEWIAEFADIGRMRCTTFVDHRGPGVALRMIATRAATAEQLGLSREVLALATEPQGLVLVAGPRAGGKSTLLSALVDHVNRQRADYIITLERQIRLLHDHKQGLISQREIRGGPEDLLSATRLALRENPGVLVIDDPLSPHMIPLLLTAAADGVLVFVAMTAASASDAVARFVDLAPPETRRAVLSAMAESFRGAVAQVLLKKSGGGLIAAREVLLATGPVARVLAEGQLGQLPVTIDGGRTHGMVSFTDALAGFVRSGAVDVREAFRKAPDRDHLLETLKRDGIDTSVVDRLA